ncbi:MAG: class 1 fructose-bisphosphatase [Pseudomonadota bacterium]|jgi:fructose-1,6-bisphosphatase I
MIPTQTLGRFIHAQSRKFPESTGELSDLLVSISLGVKIISQMVETAGFKGLHGYTGETNLHGEEVKVLDEEADEVLVEVLGSSGHFGLLVSEERDSVISTDASHSEGKYVLAFDPLDGSSNIGSSIPTGTIFCILKKKDPTRAAVLDDFRQPGSSIVAAGYAVYGAKTSFVYSTGNGVHGFTLDPSIGEFVLTEENIKVPQSGAIYSVNEGNTAFWSEGVRDFVECLKGEKATAKGPYSGRYVGSLVADFDRTLRKGGIFLYPVDSKRPNGRLRLLYECMPLAFIMEHAGGAAINGERRIVEVVPRDIHERSALIVGSPHEVAMYQTVVHGGKRKIA